jgi:flagellar protein FliL
MAAAEEKDKNSGPSLIMLVVIMLLLTLVGAGTGFAVGALLAKPAAPQLAAPAAADPAKLAAKAEAKPPAKGEAKSAEASPAAHGETAPAAAIEMAPPVEAEVPTVIVPLSPIITNLAAPEGAWVRVEGSLIARKESVEKPEVLAETTTAAILAYLRTLRLSQIEGASGFLAFRDDLDDLVKTTSNGDVRQVLVKSLVVE